ncbi:long-chain-fatty-acid--CoA ligase [Actinomadura sp. NBRC 104425]|uniref:AMP-binding protein n=1 Tax=Actinomadura sp. NBRC 104425 TaxID=3032204 RepID=UPI0024A21417|nr:AMP-binding protein [Actinomadura sp. NBRC 104425]GLZ11530.1 long-chain-fatty-acid--CoA ligase [Actinomadura sp. NBRC 104425]
MSRVTGLPSAMPPAAGRFYRQGWWRCESFTDDLHARARQTPAAVAYVNVRVLRGATETAAVTFGELADRVERLAAVLRRLGVRPGDLVALRTPNQWEAAALWLACGRVGAVTMSLSPWAGPREAEIAFTGIPIRLQVTGDASAPAAAGLAPRTVHLRELLDSARSAEPPAIAQRPQASPDAPRHVALTSGTTGRPKAVVHSCNTLYASLRAAAGFLPPRPVLTSAAGMTHASGLKYLALMPLVTGGRAVLLAADDLHGPDQWLDLVPHHGVSCLVGLPALLGRMAAAQRRRERDLSGLRRVVSLGAPLPSPTAAGIRAQLCTGLVNVFGMTEGGPLCATAPDDPSEPAEPGLGRPVGGTQVEIRRADASGAGGLNVRGPSVCLGVLDVRSGRAAWTPDRDDGWYDTGDLVRSDEHGRLHYVSRACDRVGWGPMIPTAEIESVLLGHPAVADVAVIGVPDRQGHEAACAVVVPRSARPTLDELCAFLRRRRMGDKDLPARLAVVPALPRTALGKISKAELRRQVIDGALPTEGYDALRHRLE